MKYEFESEIKQKNNTIEKTNVWIDNDNSYEKLKFVFARKNVCLPPSHKL